MRASKSIATTLAVSGLFAAVLAAAPHAFAMSDSCVARPRKDDLIPTCETGSVPANRSGHFVRYSVSPFSNYWVQDEHTKVYVASGGAGWRGKRATIFGLYGYYKLKVKGVGTYGNISNT